MSLRDPLVQEIEEEIMELVRTFNPMTPEEYERYYNEVLKPLKDSLVKASEILEKHGLVGSEDDRGD
jgi:hypothetical protein